MNAIKPEPNPGNVLLICPQFSYSFWSFRETLQIQGIKAAGSPLGLLTVAALLPGAWSLRLVDENVREVARDDWDFCDTVMLTAMIVQQERAAALIREAKERGKTVVMGGPHATSEPDFFSTPVRISWSGVKPNPPWICWFRPWSRAVRVLSSRSPSSRIWAPLPFRGGT